MTWNSLPRSGQSTHFRKPRKTRSASPREFRATSTILRRASVWPGTRRKRQERGPGLLRHVLRPSAAGPGFRFRRGRRLPGAATGFDSGSARRMQRDVVEPECHQCFSGIAGLPAGAFDYLPNSSVSIPRRTRPPSLLVRHFCIRPRRCRCHSCPSVFPRRRTFNTPYRTRPT